MSPILSICIPTNGICEWVFPVLDSIYSQDVENHLFEVVVTDNGENNDFKLRILEYCSVHSNLMYYQTDAFEFLNEIESYKLASGSFIKFINHRTKLLPGALKYMIDCIYENMEKKSVIYFSNGVLKHEGKLMLQDFDSFVSSLSYWSSWSTGMAFWKETFDLIPESESYNVLFPHSNILFFDTKNNSYIIDNTYLLEELPTNNISKGRYNLFYAFAVEYVAIICDLLRKEYISIETFTKVKKDNLKFLVSLYYSYILRKFPCSYDVSNYKKSLSVFYSSFKLKLYLVPFLLFKLVEKVRRKR